MKKSFSAMSTLIIFAVLIMLSLISSLIQFATDSFMFAAGSLKTIELTTDDFILKDFEVLENGNLLTTSVDPQLILSDYNSSGTMIRMKFSADRYPGEVNLYYTRGDEEYSNTQKIWGKAKNDGTYEYILPRGNLTNIRLDPANFANLEINIQSIVLNPRRSFLSYFTHSGEELLIFFAIGIALSCFAKCIYEAFYDKLCGLGFKFVLKKRKNNE